MPLMTTNSLLYQCHRQMMTMLSHKKTVPTSLPNKVVNKDLPLKNHQHHLQAPILMEIMTILMNTTMNMTMNMTTVMIKKLMMKIITTIITTLLTMIIP